MRVIIDRFEGNVAVVELEGGECVNMPKSLLPDGVREGDVINIALDEKETDKRKKKIDTLMDELFE